jgi:hypothetical protein
VMDKVTKRAKVAAIRDAAFPALLFAARQLRKTGTATIAAS